jgi:hypothetical protein
VKRLDAQQRERLLEDARRAFEGPIRQLADEGHVPRDDFIEAVRTIARALIAAGASRLVYEDPSWHRVGDLEKVTDEQIAAWGVRLVIDVREGAARAGARVSRTGD